jgi:hypothetical protein
MTRPPRAEDPQRWAAGLVIAVLVMVGLLALGLATQSFGFAYVLGAPFLGGYLIGRWVRVARVLRVVLALIVLASIVGGAMTTSLAGMICGAVFFAIATVPLIIGVFIGAYCYGRTWAPNAAASIALVAVLIPLEHAAAGIGSVESVSTVRVAPVPTAEVFRRITFYEDTSATPPKLLQIALPRPLRTLGSASRVGDRPRCIYDSGYLVKEITAVLPPVFYAFDVVEQRGVEDHAVQLTSGSFRLTAQDATHTRIVLTTAYRPKLSARMAWRPFERAVIHALHDHVLDEMLSGPRSSFA